MYAKSDRLPPFVSIVVSYSMFANSFELVDDKTIKWFQFLDGSIIHTLGGLTTTWAPKSKYSVARLKVADNSNKKKTKTTTATRPRCDNKHKTHRDNPLHNRSTHRANGDKKRVSPKNGIVQWAILRVDANAQRIRWVFILLLLLFLGRVFFGSYNSCVPCAMSCA